MQPCADSKAINPVLAYGAYSNRRQLSHYATISNMLIVPPMQLTSQIQAESHNSASPIPSLGPIRSPH